jgi:hypothetical protein
VPLVLASAQVSAAMLWREPVYGIAAALGGAMVLLALLGHRLDLRARYWAPASIPYYFLAMNLAIFLGLIAFLRGTQSIVWTPTARMVPLPACEPHSAESHSKAHAMSDQRVVSSVTTRVAESL